MNTQNHWRQSNQFNPVLILKVPCPRKPSSSVQTKTVTLFGKLVKTESEAAGLSVGGA